MQRSQEVIPHVNIEFTEKAIKAKQDCDWTTLKAERSLTAWVAATLRKFFQEAVADDDS